MEPIKLFELVIQDTVPIALQQDWITWFDGNIELLYDKPSEHLHLPVDKSKHLKSSSRAREISGLTIIYN
ncbi:MAG: hypothetical protein A2W28_03830 [Gammaproteobacteria bacterium RBG_16_51_14]|nr:MAG: hypothetical protein A2W28_03830 [Gammaproteobacteria bacterium RBG_16_51_14]